MASETESAAETGTELQGTGTSSFLESQAALQEHESLCEDLAKALCCTSGSGPSLDREANEQHIFNVLLDDLARLKDESTAAERCVANHVQRQSADRRPDTVLRAVPLFVPDFPSTFIAEPPSSPSACGRFWDALVEQKCDTVVALLNPLDEGTTECQQYWWWNGQLRESCQQFQTVKVTVLAEIEKHFFCVRRLRLTTAASAAEPRLVTQFQFKWPQQGVPNGDVHFADFVRLVLGYQQMKQSSALAAEGGATKTTTVVHGSAGCSTSAALFLAAHATLFASFGAKPTCVSATSIVGQLCRIHPDLMPSSQEFHFLHETLLLAVSTWQRAGGLLTGSHGIGGDSDDPNDGDDEADEEDDDEDARSLQFRPVPSPPHDNFEQMVTDPALAFVDAVSVVPSTAMSDKIPTLLARLFHAKECLFPFAVRQFDRAGQAEGRSSQEQQRIQTFAMRVAVEALRVFADDFRQALLQPVLRDLVAADESTSSQAICAAVTHFVQRVSVLQDHLPEEVRLLCFFAVGTRDEKKTHLEPVAHLLFFKFLLPAVACPQKNGLLAGQQLSDEQLGRCRTVATLLHEVFSGQSRIRRVQENQRQQHFKVVFANNPLARSILQSLSVTTHISKRCADQLQDFGIKVHLPMFHPTKNQLRRSRQQQRQSMQYGRFGRDQLNDLLEAVAHIKEAISEVLRQRHLDFKGFESIFRMAEEQQVPEEWAVKLKRTTTSASSSRSSSLEAPRARFTASMAVPDAHFPRMYTADAVKCSMHTDPVLPDGIHFNQFDSAQCISRKSCKGDYPVSSEGFPMNPFRSTGQAGRGRLLRWGPNHVMQPIIFRAAGEDGMYRRLEVLVMRPATMPEVFGSIPQMCLPLDTQSRLADIPEVVKQSLWKTTESASLFTGAELVFEGPAQRSTLDTDNAWIEFRSVFVMDDGGAFSNLPQQVASDVTEEAWCHAFKLEWEVVNEKLPLESRQYDLVCQMAARHHAKFRSENSMLFNALIDEIAKNGLDHEGLFCVSGLLKTVNLIQQEFLATVTAGDPGSLEGYDIDDLATLLKKVVRKGMVPLVPPELCSSWITTCASQPEKGLETCVINLVLQLPTLNFRNLSKLIALLQRVLSRRQFNMATAQNLARVFGPSLFPPDLTRLVTSDGGLDIAMRNKVVEVLLNMSATTWQDMTATVDRRLLVPEELLFPENCGDPCLFPARLMVEDNLQAAACDLEDQDSDCEGELPDLAGSAAVGTSRPASVACSQREASRRPSAASLSSTPPGSSPPLLSLLEVAQRTHMSSQHSNFSKTGVVFLESTKKRDGRHYRLTLEGPFLSFVDYHDETLTENLALSSRCSILYNSGDDKVTLCMIGKSNKGRYTFVTASADEAKRWAAALTMVCSELVSGSGGDDGDSSLNDNAESGSEKPQRRHQQAKSWLKKQVAGLRRLR